MSSEKKKTDYVRWGAWMATAVCIIIAGDIAARPENAQKEKQELIGYRGDIQKLWSRTKTEIEELNNRAITYAEEQGLEPGAPLPPNRFHNPDDPLLKNLDSEKPVQIVRNYFTKTISGAKSVRIVIGTRATAPNQENPYAAAILRAEPNLINATWWMYPENEGALQLMRFTAKKAEKKIGNLEPGNP